METVKGRNRSQSKETAGTQADRRSSTVGSFTAQIFAERIPCSGQGDEQRRGDTGLPLRRLPSMRETVNEKQRVCLLIKADYLQVV